MMPTLRQAKKVHLSLVEAEISGRWAFLGGKLNKTDWRIEFPGGSWIQVVTAETKINIKGIRCDVVIVDECDGVDIDVFNSSSAPWMSENDSLRIVLFCGTPERGRQGLLYQRFKMGVDGVENHISSHATYRDVPEYVNNEFVEQQRRITNPATFQREWEANFDSAEGLVYPMFSKAVHVREPGDIRRFHSFIIGADWGFNDPGVFVVLGVYGRGNDMSVHQIEEVWAKNEVPSFWVQKAKDINRKYAEIAPTTWFCDPSRPEMIKSFRGVGCRIGDTFNDIEDGIQSVADLVAVRPLAGASDNAPDADAVFTRFHVAPSCKETIREFGVYRRKRDPQNPDVILDIPLDKDNHSQDAVRYAIYSYIGRAQDRVKYEAS